MAAIATLRRLGSQPLRMVFGNAFARNWSLLAFSSLASQALGMLATIRISRALAPAGYGLYGLVLTLGTLSVLASGLGFRNTITRETARHPDQSRSLLVTSALLRIPTIAIIGAGVLVYAQLSAQVLPVIFGLVVVLLAAALSAWEILEAVAFGHQRMQYSAVINLGGAVLWLAAITLTPGKWLTPLYVSIAFAMLQVVEIVPYLILGRRARIFGGGLRVHAWRDLVHPSLPFYWLGILTAINTSLPVVFLASRSGTAAVGIFSLGSRLMSPLSAVLVTALMALYPGMARAAVSDPHRLSLMARRALLGIVGLGTACAVAISLLRWELVQFLFGPAYRQTPDVMAFLIWTVVLTALRDLVGYGLAAIDRQKLEAVLSTVYTVIVLPLLWWGAGHGPVGFAQAALLAMALNMISYWIAFRRALPEHLSNLFGLTLGVILIAGIAVSWLIPESAPLALRVGLSILVVAGVVVPVAKRTLTRQDAATAAPQGASLSEAQL